MKQNIVLYFKTNILDVDKLLEVRDAKNVRVWTDPERGIFNKGDNIIFVLKGILDNGLESTIIESAKLGKFNIRG